MKIILRLLGPMALLSSLQTYAGDQGTDLSNQLREDCGRPITVDLKDYSYGRDEEMAYDYPGLEYCQRITSLLGGACRKHSANSRRLARVSTIFCQRGSLGDRRLIVRRNGDLVLLSVNIPNVDFEGWVKQELTQKLKIDFQADEAREKAQAAKAMEETREKAQAAERDKKAEVQQQKIAALTTWFQAEVKKISARPSPDVGAKLEKLSKEYQEKLNAITNP